MKSLWTFKEKRKPEQPSILLKLLTLASNSIPKSRLLVPKRFTSLQIKAILIMDLVLKVFSEADVDFIKTFKATLFSMPEYLNLWLLAIINCSWFGF